MSAVYSALRQKNIEKEIIIVDDNGVGTDEQKQTEAVLHELIIRDKITYLCHNTNRNGSAARNTGLKKSTGKYVAFLDDDDYLIPEKTYKQIAILEQNPECVMCVCSGYYVDLNGVGYKITLRRETDMLYKYLLDKAYFNTSAILFKRDILVGLGGFDESFQRHQDWELVTRVLSENDACVLEDAEMIRFLEGRNNPSTYERKIRNLEYFFDQCEPYMLKRLSKTQIQKVKTFRRREICQNMIRAGRLKEAYEFGNEYGGRLEILRAGVLLLPLAARKLVYGSQKVAPGKYELMQDERANSM